MYTLMCKLSYWRFTDENKINIHQSAYNVMTKQWPNNISHIGNYRAKVDIKQKKPLSATV